MFQFNSQTIGLTYPQSKLTFEQLNDWINTFFSDYGLIYSCIARELHKDGGTHFHLAIKLSKSFRCRDQRQWDLHGEHPNLNRPRNFQAWVTYCKKDGDYRETGTIKTNRPSSSPDSETIISNATDLSRVEFLVWASVNKVSYAKDIWESIHSDKGTTIKDGDIFGGIMHPLFNNIKFTMEWLGPKALILVGDSGLGKTTWAKTNIPKPSLFVTHIDELKAFKNGYHKSILFDDVSFKHYPVQSQIHLVDFFDSRSIHVRYGTAYIPAGTIKFFTCNEDPLDLTHPAIARRCKTVRVIKPDF